MKLFWKFFFTTMFVSVTCLAIGGYILISSNLHTLLDNEVQTAYDYGDIVYYSLANELNTASYSRVTEYSSTMQKVRQVAAAIHINNMNQKIPFRIFDDSGNVIFSSLTETLDQDMLSVLDAQQKGWTLKKENSRIYIQTIQPAVYRNETFYIETVRDASYVFDGQRAQYETFVKIMIAMVFIAGIFTFGISKLLIKRVVFLSRVTNDISNGNLSKRAPVNGSDEITVLSKNFNRMADDLEQKIYALQDEANKKELFVGAFSHELKTPLTAIIGYSDMLRRKKMDQEQQHLCAEYIFAEGKRLEHLSMRLMDLIVLKNQEVYLAPVDISHLCNEVCSAFIPQLSECHITLLCDVESAIIPMERDFMKTVFINLIDNAKKAIEANGQIQIKGRQRRGYYAIRIQDTGNGMEQQELAKIKEAFYMVDKSRTRKQGGVGLGLAICDAIVKLHGFEIGFESTPGIGTTVTITMRGVKKDA